MLFAISGPEKAGKSTLVDQLASTVRVYGWHVIHCRCRRPQDFDPLAYLDMIELGLRSDTLVILDRSWPDDAVYNDMLDRTVSYDEAEYEWHIGTAVRALGCKLMLTATPKTLIARRSSDDLDVDPLTENLNFLCYGLRWGWPVASSDPPYSDGGGDIRDLLVASITHHLIVANRNIVRGIIPPHISGNPRAQIAVLGEGDHLSRRDGARWLPFTRSEHAWMREVVAPPYDSYLYASAGAVFNHGPLEELLSTKRIIALGKDVSHVAKIKGWDVIATLPDPLVQPNSREFARIRQEYDAVFREVHASQQTQVSERK